MSASTSEFQQLLDEVRAGSQDAAWRMIDLYGRHIRRVVVHHLDRRLRSQFDSCDFVQAVWASFFRDPAEIHSFEEPEEIIAFLARVARNKVIDEVRRRLQMKKHNVLRTASLETPGVQSDLRTSGPSPSEVAMARERWQRLVEKQSDRNREILRLRFIGCTYEEIASRLSISERTARRVIDQLVELQSA